MLHGVTATIWRHAHLDTDSLIHTVTTHHGPADNAATIIRTTLDTLRAQGLLAPT